MAMLESGCSSMLETGGVPLPGPERPFDLQKHLYLHASAAGNRATAGDSGHVN